MARLVVTTMTNDLESIKGVDLAKMVDGKNKMMGRIGTIEQDIIITRGAKVLVVPVDLPAEAVDIIIDFLMFAINGPSFRSG